MKRCCFLILLFRSLLISGQSLPEGDYLKYAITTDGIYSIDLKKLNQGPNGTQPVLYWRGKPVDFDLKDNLLQFYGERNRGELDSSVYLPKSAQPHQKISIFSDTSFYYLAFEKNAVLHQMAKPSFKEEGLKTLRFALKKQETIYTNEWTFSPYRGPLPSLESAYFEKGETYSSGLLKKDSVFKFKFDAPDLVATDLDKIKVDVQINGRDNFRHVISAKVNDEVISNIAFSGFEHHNINTAFSAKPFDISIHSAGPDAFDRWAVNYVSISYPAGFEISPNTHLQIPEKGKAVWKFNGKIEEIWDVTNSHKPIQIAVVNQSSTFTESALVYAGNSTELTDGKPFKHQKFKDFAADFLILTTPEMYESASEFARYRSSKEGGGFKTSIVNVNNLYHEFNFGVRGPVAIKNFLESLYLLDKKDRFVLLIGPARSIYDNKTSGSAYARDRVPTLGFPGSDNALSAGFKGLSPFVPYYATGRISSTSNAEVLDYLAKIKSYENQKDESWKKNIMHLSGGRTIYDLNYFKAVLNDFGQVAQGGEIGANVLALHKKTTDPVEKLVISKELNQGAGIVTFFGHSSPSGPDIDIGLVSDPSRGYNNDKYPLMIFNGCGIGNIYYGASLLSTNWLLTPKKGAILVLNHTYSGYSTPLYFYTTELYKTMGLAAFYNEPFGKIHKATIENYLKKQGNSDFDQVNALLMNIQGDPAVRIFKNKHADYNVSDIFVQSGSQTFGESNTWQVGMSLKNKGRYLKDQKVSISVKIDQSLYSFETNAIANAEVVVFDVPKPKATDVAVVVNINADQRIIEEDYSNNSASLSLNTNEISDLKVFPASVTFDKTPPNILIKTKKIELENRVFINPNDTLTVFLEDNMPLKNATGLVVSYTECEECPQITIKNNVAIDAYSQKIAISGIWQPGKTLRFFINAIDAAGNQYASEPKIIDVNINTIPEAEKVSVFPNPTTDYLNINYACPNTVSELGISLIAQNGQTVDQHTYQNLSAGQHSLLIDFRSLSLPNGRYMLQTKSGQTTTARTILLIK